MLDHDDSVSLLHQLVQDIKQFGHVMEVQACSGLIEDIERTAGRAFRQLLGKLHPLRLAARQSGRLLPHMDVAQPDPLQELKACARRGTALKNCAASSTVMSSTSAIDFPLNVTSKVSRL